MSVRKERCVRRRILRARCDDTRWVIICNLSSTGRARRGDSFSGGKASRGLMVGSGDASSMKSLFNRLSVDDGWPDDV